MNMDLVKVVNRLDSIDMPEGDRPDRNQYPEIRLHVGKTCRVDLKKIGLHSKFQTQHRRSNRIRRREINELHAFRSYDGNVILDRNRFRQSWRSVRQEFPP